jgi:hypothetical protein
MSGAEIPLQGAEPHDEMLIRKNKTPTRNSKTRTTLPDLGQYRVPQPRPLPLRRSPRIGLERVRGEIDCDLLSGQVEVAQVISCRLD